MALAADGAYLGQELSNDDPLATAADAAGGVIVSETLRYAAKRKTGKAYASGYLMNDTEPLAAYSVAITNPREMRRGVKRGIFAFTFCQPRRFDCELRCDDGHDYQQ